MPPITPEIIANRLLELSVFTPGLSQLSAAILDAIDTHTDDWTIPLTAPQKTPVLKSMTGFLSILDVHLACYPVGYVTTILFDENGNPV